MQRRATLLQKPALLKQLKQLAAMSLHSFKAEAQANQTPYTKMWTSGSHMAYLLLFYVSLSLFQLSHIPLVPFYFA